MKIFSAIEEISDLAHPVAVTIGNFDGVHLGHQAILQRMHQLVHPVGKAIAITFPIKPSNLIHPEASISSICTAEHKMQLLQQLKIDYLFIPPFTKEFASQSAKDFLNSLKQNFSMDVLILGHDAKLGKEREGTKEKVLSIASALNFNAEYLPPLSDMHGPISSTRIRECIINGKLHEASLLLGRPYSIYSKVSQGSHKGKKLGFPTANINVDDLCLPPGGVYAVSVKYADNEVFGVANLGTAPTFNETSGTKLEVHLFDFDKDIYGEYIEVIFHQFIRPEQRFSSVHELQSQIAEDIAFAKNLFRNKALNSNL